MAKVKQPEYRKIYIVERPSTPNTPWWVYNNYTVVSRHKKKSDAIKAKERLQAKYQNKKK